MAQISIDDVIYDLDTLPDAAKQQMANVQMADGEILRLQQQMALAQTARNTYFSELKKVLPRDSSSGGSSAVTVG